MVVRRELLGGLDRLNATTALLQRARRADPLRGFWEASDVQWWRGRLRATDDLELPVWIDDVGPVGAVGLTASGEIWQADIFVVPSLMSEAEVWAETMDAAAEHWGGPLELLVNDVDTTQVELAVQSGFVMTDELSGTSWMEADEHPPITEVDGFVVVDRTVRSVPPHPMIARNGAVIEERLRQCTLYDPELDLAVVNTDGQVAGYALFWFDATTLVGQLEPMRVNDDFQRLGLARMLLTNGLDRLVRKGAARLKVGFQTDAAKNLYLTSGFVQTSVDRLLTRSA
jgi:predicted N-acetyltransferase YhbS